MKFGIMQLVGGGYGRTDKEAIDEAMETVELAEELGFDAVWFGEHHFTDYGLVGNTLQVLAAAAARTERIRLGAAVVVAPLHNPVRVAEEAAMVDVLSNGRLDLGIGRGYQPSEFESFGLTMDGSRAKAEELVRFLEECWQATEPFEFRGEHFSSPSVWAQPSTVQKPGPPLWHACVSPESFEIAGRNGRQVLTSPNFTPLKMVKDSFAHYRATLVENGFDPASFSYPVVQHAYIGADDESAYQVPREACMSFFGKLGSLLPDDVKNGDASGDSFSSLAKTKRKIADLQYDYLYEQSVTFGSPQRAIERIRFLRTELGMDYFMGMFKLASLTTGQTRESMRRFAEEVMPEVRDLEPQYV